MRRLPRRVVPLLAVAVLWPALAAAPVAPQVFDINQVATGPIGSSPHSPVTLNGAVIFTAFDVTHGNELWVTDGTTMGTRLLADLWPGPVSSSPNVLATLGSKLLFSANDGSSGTELWITDGTAAGTKQVMDLNPGPADGLSSQTAAVVGPVAYFVATDGMTGNELWVTDGTAAGTHEVLDANPGPTSGAVAPVIAFNGNVYFSGNDGTHGAEPWKSDGTAMGTAMLVDLNPGLPASNPGFLLATASALLFSANDGTHGVEPFVTAGAASSTTLLLDANPMTASSSPHFPVALGSKALFIATTATGTTLMVTDGTPANTLALGAAANVQPAALGTQAVFTGTEATHGNELWVTDGTVMGTVLLDDIIAGATGSSPSAYVAGGGRVWFVANDGIGASLFSTDGTAMGTTNLASNAQPGALHVSGSGLYFTASDATHGIELWHSDGTAMGTALVSDVNPGTGTGVGQLLADLGAKLLFTANDGVHGAELWATDGSAMNTVLVDDIEPGNGNGSSNPDLPLIVGPLAFFTANDGVNGLQVWRTDGTQAGTFSPTIGKITAVQQPPVPFQNCPTPREATLKAYSGGVAFIASDMTNGTQLWVSDGTAAGTLSPTATKSLTLDNASFLAVMDDIIYFAATDATHGREVWSTDGTVAGTALLVDLVAGTGSSNPRAGAALGDQLIFIADLPLPPATGIQTAVVASDGSGPGTAAVGTLGPTGPAVGPPVVGSSKVFFPLRVVTTTTTIRVGATDGNAAHVTLDSIDPQIHELVPYAGGVLYAAIPGPGGSHPFFWSGLGTASVDLDGRSTRPAVKPRNFTVAGPLAYYVADDASGVAVLFVTDGTAGAGTHHFSSTRIDSTRITGTLNDQLLFSFNNTFNVVIGPGHFRKLATLNVTTPNNVALDLPFFFDHVFFPGNNQVWETNGTPEGTFQVTQTAGQPQNFVILGDQLLVSAISGFYGRELMGVPLDATPPDITPLVQGTMGDGGFFTSDVNVTWQIVENDSQIQSEAGCQPVVVTADTPGSTFTCSATSLGGTGTRSVTIKRDATKPVVICPTNVIAEASSASGAMVDFPAPVAQDAIDPNPTVTEDHAPGSTFALGMTPVTATATDAAGNKQTCGFVVAVRDTTAPAVTCPAAMNVEATGANGAAVTFTPTATDLVDPAPQVTASPASGTTLPLGETLVQVLATDASGNHSGCEFLVTVRDQNAPMVTCPPDQTAADAPASGIAVTYPDPMVSDPADPMPLVTENHISGDTFPVGTTTVQVVATNHAGLSSTCRFKVTVTSKMTETPPVTHCGCDAGPGLGGLLALAALIRRRRRPAATA